MLFSEKVLAFLGSLQIKQRIPKGVAVLNPYRDKIAFGLCQTFYQKYYSDQNERTAVIGINPGRHGAGLTGVPFTDPVKLQDICGIPNEFPKKAELSADFIHAMIKRYGGVESFFGNFYITSVSPLGFTSNGVNLNYYDHPALARAIRPFMIDSLKTQIAFGLRTDKAFCLGEGANFKFLSALNKDENFFREIVPLSHPRFIMQYRRKFVEDYIGEYLKELKGVSTDS
jgi:hypothetical protein